MDERVADCIVLVIIMDQRTRKKKKKKREKKNTRTATAEPVDKRLWSRKQVIPKHLLPVSVAALQLPVKVLYVRDCVSFAQR
jgi:predicted RND superfamily exporter protein